VAGIVFDPEYHENDAEDVIEINALFLVNLNAWLSLAIKENPDEEMVYRRAIDRYIQEFIVGHEVYHSDFDNAALVELFGLDLDESYAIEEALNLHNTLERLLVTLNFEPRNLEIWMEAGIISASLYSLIKKAKEEDDKERLSSGALFSLSLAYTLENDKDNMVPIFEGWAERVKDRLDPSSPNYSQKEEMAFVLAKRNLRRDAFSKGEEGYSFPELENEDLNVALYAGESLLETLVNRIIKEVTSSELDFLDDPDRVETLFNFISSFPTEYKTSIRVFLVDAMDKRVMKNLVLFYLRGEEMKEEYDLALNRLERAYLLVQPFSGELDLPGRTKNVLVDLASIFDELSQGIPEDKLFQRYIDKFRFYLDRKALLEKFKKELIEDADDPTNFPVTQLQRLKTLTFRSAIKMLWTFVDIGEDDKALKNKKKKWDMALDDNDPTILPEILAAFENEIKYSSNTRRQEFQELLALFEILSPLPIQQAEYTTQKGYDALKKAQAALERELRISRYLDAFPSYNQEQRLARLEDFDFDELEILLQRIPEEADTHTVLVKKT